MTRAPPWVTRECVCDTLRVTQCLHCVIVIGQRSFNDNLYWPKPHFWNLEELNLNFSSKKGESLGDLYRRSQLYIRAGEEKSLCCGKLSRDHTKRTS